MAHTTIIDFYNVLFNNTYTEVLYTETDILRDAHFSTPAKHTTGNHEIRINNTSITVRMTYTEALSYNYLRYKNNDREGWVYCFITSVVYDSENNTKLEIEIDVMQTYQPWMSLKSAFLKRHHENDVNYSNDQLNIESEPFDLKDSFITVSNFTKRLKIAGYIVTLKSRDSVGVMPFTTGSTAGFYPDILNREYYNMSQVRDGTFINAINAHADSDNLIDIIPAFKIHNADTIGALQPAYKITDVDSFIIPDVSDGERKLLTGQFCKICLTTNAGTTAEFNPEMFPDNLVLYHTTVINGTPTSISVRISDKDGYSYSGEIESNTGITYTEDLSFSFSADSYNLWKNQNQGKNTSAVLTTALSAVGTVAGLATANPIVSYAGIAGIVTSVGNIASQHVDAKAMPDQAKNKQNSGYLSLLSDGFYVNFAVRCVKESKKEEILSFLRRYGYSQNKVVTRLNHNVCNHFTYIECENVSFTVSRSDFPTEKIQAIYQRGCTFWNLTTDGFGDYNRYINSNKG